MANQERQTSMNSSVFMTFICWHLFFIRYYSSRMKTQRKVIIRWTNHLYQNLLESLLKGPPVYFQISSWIIMMNLIEQEWSKIIINDPNEIKEKSQYALFEWKVVVFISNHIYRCSRRYIITSVLITLLVILIIATILLVLLIKSTTKRIRPSNIGA